MGAQAQGKSEVTDRRDRAEGSGCVRGQSVLKGFIAGGIHLKEEDLAIMAVPPTSLMPGLMNRGSDIPLTHTGLGLCGVESVTGKAVRRKGFAKGAIKFSGFCRLWPHLPLPMGIEFSSQCGVWRSP